MSLSDDHKKNLVKLLECVGEHLEVLRYAEDENPDPHGRLPVENTDYLREAYVAVADDPVLRLELQRRTE